MSQLPVLTAVQVLKALERGGFFVHHVKGSHYAIRHSVNSHLRITLPYRRGDMKMGTLKSVLSQANLTVEEFLRLL